MSGRNRQDDWDDNWDDDWDDDESRPESPVKRFIDWSGFGTLFAKKSDEGDEEAGQSGGILAWSRTYGPRLLSLLFFVVGLILILRLAVVHAGM